MAEESGGGSSGGGGTSVSNTYVTVNGGQNTLGHADDTTVNTSVTNITSDNVTVYVYGDYNPTYLYRPRVSELHMANNTNGALWNPTTDELPNTLHASVMHDAGIAILYDGWIDLEHSGDVKPQGATREGEILGYDIYAKLGERYEPAGSSYVYVDSGLYKPTDPVNYTWSIMQLYRAMDIEQVEFYVQTEKRESSAYDINASPLAQFITMATAGVDLSAVISNVYATRTNPDTYLELASTDCIGVVPASNREKQTLSIAEFCLLAYTLMDLYGEPVLTEQETYLLLEAYGRDLPYGLPEAQLEAVKYLLARGIIESNMDWRSDITFEDAATILMRIKDEDSRLTFKEVQLSTDVSLLSKGYYPTEVSTYQSPILITEDFSGYDAYNSYDYFVEVVDGIEFKSPSGNSTFPFICAGDDSTDGVLAGTQYQGRVTINEREFYHFRANKTLDTIGVNSRKYPDHVFINTARVADTPAQYVLPAPGTGNEGGCWLSTGSIGSVTNDTWVDGWEWFPLDKTTVEFPAEYLDRARDLANVEEYDTQLSLFNESSYGFAFRVSSGDLGNVKFTAAGDVTKTLANVTSGVMNLPNGMKLRRTQDVGQGYRTFELLGCSNRNTLSEIFQCDAGASYQAYPAFAKQNRQFLVSIDYLKSLGVVWSFEKTSDRTYYLGIKSITGTRTSEPMYTSVYLGTTASSSYVIRGSQLTLYTPDTAIVVEADTGYYVDYSAVLGVSDTVGFLNENGEVTLSLDSGLEGVTHKKVYNVNNSTNGSDCTGEWAAQVTVLGEEESVPYIYCPVTYPLANWLTVDNHLDGQLGVFTFFAVDPDPNSENGEREGNVKLRDMLGVDVAKEWAVYYQSLPPIGAIEAKYDAASGAYKIGEGDLPPIAYIPQYEAFLIKPNILDPDAGFSTYGGFVDASKDGFVSSLVYNASTGYLGDWNYNWYRLGGTYTAKRVVHMFRDSEGNVVRKYIDISNYTHGAFSDFTDMSSGPYSEWVPAPVGIPGLLGYPEAMYAQLTHRKNVNTYSGILYAVRNEEGGAVLGDGGHADALKYSMIHATPNSMWIQTCGFAFTVLAESRLGTAPPRAPNLQHGDASPGFDWGEFLQNIGLQNADDWLTIAIIAVLNILPRIFMFAFVLLMGLALIANVKPWQLFCDSVFDPYKLLTFGRKDVHTIQVKMVFLYSIIALALFGMFQNGLILEVIAWVARAVTGIFSR